MDKKVLRNLSYGVYVVTTKDDEKDVGCVANSVMQVTSNPATVAVSINHDNYTNKCVKKSKTFAVSILKNTSDPKIIGEFGFKTSKETDKFKDFKHQKIDDVSVINDSCGYVVCKLIDKMETSTHTVFLGEVINAEGYTDEEPMTYKYYHEKLRGSAPKNAPTYQANNKEKKGSNKIKRWKCSVCGYVYEGESLPEDFVCPICGQPREKFYEID